VTKEIKLTFCEVMAVPTCFAWKWNFGQEKQKF